MTSEPQSGRVVIISSADIGKNEVLHRLRDPRPNARFLLNLVELLSLDARLLRIGTMRPVTDDADSVSASEPFADLIRDLKGTLSICFYRSERLPGYMRTAAERIVDLLHGVQGLSDGRFRFEVVNPIDAAGRYAIERVEEYYATRDNGGIPSEPSGRESLERLLSGGAPTGVDWNALQKWGLKAKKPDAQICEERWEKARAFALRKSEGTLAANDEFRRLLSEEFEELFFWELEIRGISPMELAECGHPQRCIYSSIVLQRDSREIVVGAFTPSQVGFEFELAKGLLKLVRARKSRILWIVGASADPQAAPVSVMKPRTSEYDRFISILQMFFDVERVGFNEAGSVRDVTDRLNEKRGWRRDSRDGETYPIDCLVVAHPHDLDARRIQEIAWIASEGIPTIFLVSAYSLDVSEKGAAKGFPLAQLNHGLSAMLRGWGLALGEGLLASRSCESLQDVSATIPTDPLGREPTSDALPILVASQESCLRRTHPLEPPVGGVVFPAAVAIELDAACLEKAGIVATVLACSSAKTYTVTLQAPVSGEILLTDRRELLDAEEEHNDGRAGSVPPAVLLEGKLPYPFLGEASPSRTTRAR